MTMMKNKLYAKLTRSFLRKWWLVIILALGLLFGAIFVLFFFTSIVNVIVDMQLPLTEGSMTYDLWRKPPVHPMMKIYIFNVTNVDEFLNNGSKPVLQEIGPYVYEETWEKVNLRSHDNGTITFNQKKTFRFMPELSNGSEDDWVVMPNIPLLSATTKAKTAPKFIRIAINFMAKQKDIKPFVEVTVGQFLWGYEDPLMSLAKEMSPDAKLPFDQFGLLVGKNATSPNNVTVYTGATDMTKFGAIEKVNGETKLPHYSADSCNQIEGSEGSVFPPHMTHDTILYFYEKDLCRRLPLRFQKEVMTYSDIPGWRFSVPNDVFATPDVNKENACFCSSSSDCAPSGTFNVSACQFDSPVLLSFPHFYLGDPKLLTGVEGVSKPDPAKHELYVDVKPEMGVPLRATVRLQINLAVSHTKDIDVVTTFPDLVLPILWFEDGVDHLPDDICDLIKLATEVPPVARVALLYVLFVCGTILLVTSVFCLVRTSNRREIMVLGNAAHFIAQDEADKKKKAAMPGFTAERQVEAKDNAGFVGDNAK